MSDRPIIFIVWSGAIAERVSEILREGLPQVVTTAEIWTSEELEKGSDWYRELTTLVQNAAAAVVCVTRDNVGSPWLHFEAGALWSQGKRVCPYLVGARTSDLAATPLAHLQATDAFDKKDVLRLVRTLNRVTRTEIGDSALRARFDDWWTNTFTQFKAIPMDASQSDVEAAREFAQLMPDLDAALASPSVKRKRTRPAKTNQREEAIPFPDRRLTRSAYEKVFLKLVSGESLFIEGRWFKPVGMKGWYHAIFRREPDGRERLFTIDQLLQNLDAFEDMNSKARDLVRRENEPPAR